MGIRINSLEIQNVKKVKALSLDIGDNSLVVIGGKNGQGKTSVLDAICFALGGERYRPSALKREGSVADAEIRIELSNGLIVERKGKNAALKVIDPEGRKSGQALLTEMVSELALNLPKFLDASDTEKAKTLLSVLGIGDELARLEREESKFYDERHALGVIADQKKKFAAEMPCYDDMPEELVTAAELLNEQKKILAHNAENLRKRNNAERILSEKKAAEREISNLEDRIVDLNNQKQKAVKNLETINRDICTLEMSMKDLTDRNTAEIESKLAEIEETNAKIRANKDKVKAGEDAAEFSARYNEFTAKVEAVRAERMALLEGADLPLPGLTVEGGELLFNGMKWDCMSGAERLRVGTAIVRKLNPNCGFVLMDRLEQMDVDTIRGFAQWLSDEGLQAIATRVSTGDECSVVIEDGAAVDDGRVIDLYQAVKTTKFVEGRF